MGFSGNSLEFQGGILAGRYWPTTRASERERERFEEVVSEWRLLQDIELVSE